MLQYKLLQGENISVRGKIHISSSLLINYIYMFTSANWQIEHGSCERIIMLLWLVVYFCSQKREK